jgi:gamma-glutamylcyclotransferase (GGCT)/AIG2-like uncharacterized protein YtfP
MLDAPLRLFVYGSLQRGFENHAELRGAERVRAARTAPSYRLLLHGSFPALAAGGTRAIHGELYRVSAALLDALDEFEGEGYVRAEVALSDGTTAIAYLATAELAARAPELAHDAWSVEGCRRQRDED